MKERKRIDSKSINRKQRIWKFFSGVVSTVVRKNFDYSFDSFHGEEIEGPLIIVINHACAWDPILVRMAFPDVPLAFIASEHILRTPSIKRFLGLVDIIPYKKGTSSVKSIYQCLERIRAGESIFLAAEGEQSWDGISGTAGESAGKLIKKTGATMVTFRIEGAYLSQPRWAGQLRKGRVQGRIVNIYPPEKLEKMTPLEIREAVNQDIFFDVWKWQEEMEGGPHLYKSKGGGAAEGIDTAICLCPNCFDRDAKSLGTLRATGNRLSCSCGFRVEYREDGFFQPSHPFSHIGQWISWEDKELRSFENLSDSEATLVSIGDNHREIILSQGPISLNYPKGRSSGVLSVGREDFPTEDILKINMILNNRIVFSTKDGYYEIRAKNTNLRKYVAVIKGK